MGMTPWAWRSASRRMAVAAVACSRCRCTWWCTSVGVRRPLLPCFKVGVRVMPRAVGGWVLGRDARAAGPGIVWPWNGQWGRQESVRVRVSKVTETRDLLCSDTLKVVINVHSLAV